MRAELSESQNDIKKAEIKVLEACGWNPLYTTVLELLEFYMTQGVVFSDDKITSENGHEGMARRIRKQAGKLAKHIVKGWAFLSLLIQKTSGIALLI